MAGSTLKVHIVSNMRWAPLKELAGYIADDVAPLVQPEVANGDGPVIPMGLAFTDPDGEAHVYVLDDAAKQALVKKLTGGVVLPS